MEPENTVFVQHYFVTKSCITLYSHTPIHLDGGEYIKNKSFLQYVARAPTAKTQIFQGKKQQLGFDRFTMTPDSCGGSGLDLKGLKGPRTERAEKDGTSGHP